MTRDTRNQHYAENEKFIARCIQLADEMKEYRPRTNKRKRLMDAIEARKVHA